MRFHFLGWERSIVSVAGLALVAAGGLFASGCPAVTPPDLHPQPDATDTHWLRLAQITDIHILDEESPARFIRFDSFNQYAWRPQDGYTAQTLDATLGVINGIHEEGKDAGRPVDCVMVSGDVTDNVQYNELRWFIDTMDGGTVLTDSGILDGPLRDVAPEDNPKLPFVAGGIDKDIPWYVTCGNHDNLGAGNFNIHRESADPADWYAPLLGPVAWITGLHDFTPPTNDFLPTSDQSPAIVRASEELIDPDTLQLRIDLLEAGASPADANRRYLSKKDFIDEFFTTATEPMGHGFPDDARVTGTTWYSVRPKAGVPVRLVVMDTVADAPPDGIPVEYGVMTRDQFENFVKPTIEAAQTAGEYVILVSHHPSENFDKPYPGQSVKTREFRDYVASRPNVIAHIAGHEHYHAVTLVDGDYPYLEILTASLIDYPQEGRILDVFYDETAESLRLESTVFSHMNNPTRLSLTSFRRAVIDMEYNKGAKANVASGAKADLFAAACKANGIEFTEWDALGGASERNGDATDRNFTAVFHRPKF